MSGSRGLIKSAGVIVALGLIDVADRELLDFNKTRKEREKKRRGGGAICQGPLLSRLGVDTVVSGLSVM